MKKPSPNCYFTQPNLLSKYYILRPRLGPSHWVMDKTGMLLCPFYSRGGHASQVPEQARYRGPTRALQPRLLYPKAQKLQVSLGLSLGRGLWLKGEGP